MPRIAELCAWHKHELRLTIDAGRIDEISSLLEQLTHNCPVPDDRPVLSLRLRSKPQTR